MIAIQNLLKPLSKGLIFAISCIGLMTSPVYAQIAPSKNLEPLKLPPLPKKELPKKKFGNWTQVCEARPGVVKQKCFLTQTVVQTKEGRKLGLLGITVGNFGPEKKLGAIFRVPLALGVFLPSGFKLNIAGIAPIPIAVQFCLTQGCSATIPLSKEVIAAMKKQDSGSLEVQTIKKRVIRVPISLKGFSAGLDSLTKG